MNIGLCFSGLARSFNHSILSGLLAHLCDNSIIYVFANHWDPNEPNFSFNKEGAAIPFETEMNQNSFQESVSQANEIARGAGLRVEFILASEVYTKPPRELLKTIAKPQTPFWRGRTLSQFMSIYFCDLNRIEYCQAQNIELHCVIRVRADNGFTKQVPMKDILEALLEPLPTIIVRSGHLSTKGNIYNPIYDDGWFATTSAVMTEFCKIIFSLENYLSSHNFLTPEELINHHSQLLGLDAGLITVNSQIQRADRRTTHLGLMRLVRRQRL